MLFYIIILFEDFGMVSATNKNKTNFKNMRFWDVDDESN